MKLNTAMPRRVFTGSRPDLWCTGPDPVRHQRYVAWNRARAQAQWRGEIWSLNFMQFEQVWQDRWHLRGRHRDDLCMCRRDPDLPWRRGNVQLVSRADHVRTTHSRATRRWA